MGAASWVHIVRPIACSGQTGKERPDWHSRASRDTTSRAAATNPRVGAEVDVVIAQITVVQRDVTLVRDVKPVNVPIEAHWRGFSAAHGFVKVVVCLVSRYWLRRTRRGDAQRSDAAAVM